MTVPSPSSPAVSAPADLSGAALDRSLIRGIAWMAVVKWAGQLVAWLSTFIVARLLSPADYGIVGAASLYLGLLTIISEFGIGSAIIFLRQLSPSVLRQVNTVSAIFGLSGFLLSAGLAHWVAAFFNAPRAAPVVVALSATFLISSFKTVPWALLQRDMRFRRVAMFDGAQQVALAVLSVVLAVAGYGYWTLVIAAVLSALIPATLALALHWVGYERPRWHDLRRVLGFSKEIIVQRIAWYAYSNSDFLVAGRVLGEAALGAYTLAWTVAHAPLDRVGNVILQVAPPTLSAVQDDPAALRRYVLAISGGVSLVTFPLFVGLAIVAPDFVPVVLGQQWRSMIVPLQVLALYACLRAVLPLLAQVLIVRGDQRFVARNMLLAAVILPLGFIVGSHWGISGIAFTWLLIHPIIAYRLCRRAFAAIGLTLRTFSLQLWPAVSACVAMALVVLGLHFTWPGAAGVHAELVTEVALGAATYGSVLAVFHRDRLLGVRRFAAAFREDAA